MIALNAHCEWTLYPKTIRETRDLAQSVTTHGAGFRYKIARVLGLYAGLDAGWGPDDRAVCVQVGSAWR
jgi:hypothetical protein